MTAFGSDPEHVGESIEMLLWSIMWLGILAGWLLQLGRWLAALWTARRGRHPKLHGEAFRVLGQIALLAWALTLALPALASAQGWWWGSPVNPGFERSTVIRVSGTVKSVSIDARSSPASLDLECPRDTYTVMLGPGWYLAQVGMDVREGDPLTVEGSKMMDRRGRLHLVAALVKNERTGAALKLRDDAGRPVWMGKHPRGNGR